MSQPRLRAPPRVSAACTSPPNVLEVLVLYSNAFRIHPRRSAPHSRLTMCANASRTGCPSSGRELQLGWTLAFDDRVRNDASALGGVQSGTMKLANGTARGILLTLRGRSSDYRLAGNRSALPRSPSATSGRRLYAPSGLCGGGRYVVAQARRQGIGRALIQAAERWAAHQGCTELGSDAPRDNEVSHGLSCGPGI